MKRLHFHLTTDQTDLLLARGKSLFARLSDGTVQLWNSCWYFPLLLLVMLAALATGQPVLGVIVLGLLASWFLAFCPDLVAAITPFGMIFLLSTSEYENLGSFLPCVFLLIPLMTSLVLHLTTWPVELRLGTSARGLILVSAATILGGCGVISWEQYTNPLSLYYMLGLGVCMLGVYVLFRSQLREHRTYNLQVRFAQIFCALGWGMVLVVAVTYAKNWQEFIESGSALYLSYRNFAATILLTTLPMPFYLAGLKKYHLLSAPVFMAALLLTGSRTALVFGAVLLVLCCIYLVRTGVVSKWAMLGLTAAGAAALALFGMDAVKSLYEFRLSGSGHLISGDDGPLEAARRRRAGLPAPPALRHGSRQHGALRAGRDRTGQHGVLPQPRRAGHRQHGHRGHLRLRRADSRPVQPAAARAEGSVRGRDAAELSGDADGFDDEPGRVLPVPERGADGDGVLHGGGGRRRGDGDGHAAAPPRRSARQYGRQLRAV